MKKYLSLIAVLALLVACMIPAAFAADQINMTVGNVDVELGEGTVEVEVPVSTGEIGVAAGEFGYITIYEGEEVSKNAKVTDVAGYYEKRKIEVTAQYNPESETEAKGFFAEMYNNGAVDVKGDVFYIYVEIPADKIATYTVVVSAGSASSVESNIQNATLMFKSGKITVGKHECAWGEWELTKAPTCTAKGVETRTCSICGATETRDVEMIPHTPAAAVKENEKAADCVNAGGYDMVEYCSVCKTELSRVHTEIKALGHDVKDVVPAYDCDKGVTYNKTCGRCDWTEEVVIEAHDHVWGAATVIKPATVDETGEVKYVCKHSEDHGCSGVKIEETPKLNPEEPDPTGDITPYIAMGVLTMVALISSAAYMLLKRKAI